MDNADISFSGASRMSYSVLNDVGTCFLVYSTEICTACAKMTRHLGKFERKIPTELE